MPKKSSQRRKSNRNSRGQTRRTTLAEPISHRSGWNLHTVGAILGTLLSIVGLIALRPQLNVSIDEPLSSAQPYSPVFRITNTGLTALRDIVPYCYADSIETGASKFFKVLLAHNEWTVPVLDRGETKTIVCNMLQTDVEPTRFDIALVMEYSMYGIPIYKGHRAFRWVGTPTPGGTLRLLPQPSDLMLEGALDHIHRANAGR
jgi:hypothetical protein